MTVVNWSNITGRKKDVLGRELIDLVLGQSTEAQAANDMTHGADDVSEHAAVAEVRAGESIETAKGRPPFLVPKLTVTI